METVINEILPFNWSEFHFIRPEWLLAILPLVILAWMLKRLDTTKSGWQGIVANHLYKHMTISNDKQAKSPPFGWLAVCWTLACFAIAGPAWNKLPQPAYQVNNGNVVILDMSLSMRATDVTPDRLTRARFKTIDLLNSIEEGEVGLILYAGDAFTVSPLTSDVTNITALIPSIRPEIMPVLGSDPLAAFEQAKVLLANSGYTRGNIYWITDGIEFSDVDQLRDFMANNEINVSILGIGTEEGAPIKQADGALLKDTNGNIVIPKLTARYLQSLTNLSSVKYHALTVDDSDIKAMKIDRSLITQEPIQDDSFVKGDQWQDMGALLILVMLPFLSFVFRRGVLTLFLVPYFFVYPQASMAEQTIAEEINSPSLLDTAFNTGNQLGLNAFENQNYEQAVTLFDDPMWRGASLYKQGNYEQAIEQFSQVDSTESMYNQANALAKLGDLQSAIELYDNVLESDPYHQKAIKNKQIVESLLKQQEQEQQEQSDQGNQNKEDNGEQQSDEQEQSQDQQSENDSDSQDSSDQQSSEQQSNTEDSPSDPSNNDSESNSPQEQEEQQSQSSSNEQEEEQPESENSENDEIEKENQAINAQQMEQNLTPEELEKLQRDRVLLNKVPDDPAFLLQRKMMLEAQKRKQDRLPASQRKEW